jgi:hypothetical protein
VPPDSNHHAQELDMARSKSKHNRMKSTRRQQWKARKARQAAAKKTAAKK